MCSFFITTICCSEQWRVGGIIQNGSSFDFARKTGGCVAIFFLRVVADAGELIEILSLLRCGFFPPGFNQFVSFARISNIGTSINDSNGADRGLFRAHPNFKGRGNNDQLKE